MELSQGQVQVLGALADAVKGMGTDKKGAYAHQHTGITLHGPTGIFSTFGLNREILTAHLEPEGIASVLPIKPSMDTDPRYGTVTGITGSYGSQPENKCEAAPHAYLKGCNLTARFGQLRFDTNTIEWNKVITRLNRGDFMDLQMLGSLLGNDQAAMGLVPANLTGGDLLNIVTLSEMLVAGVQMQRDLTRQYWQGTTAVVNEFPGLNAQIATGQMDADRPGVLCPALDAKVESFNYADVCGTALDIVEYVSSVAYHLQYNARKMKLAPAKWVIAMTPNLWYELSACWPCRHLTNRCQDFAGTQVGVINDESNINLREKLRKGMYLPINGISYPVVIDDGIFEHDSDNNQNLVQGQFASTVYFVPLTVLGNFPVTYREYLDYRSSVAQANLKPFMNMRRPDFWSDNGIFSWAYDGQLWCYLLGLLTEQRIILRAPQLSGRIDHVAYTPLQHLRSPMPDSDYWADGGSSGPPPQRNSYATWGTRGSGLI